MKPPALFVAALLIPASLAVMAADPSDGVRACRALSDATARLACYDALPVAGSVAAAAAVAPQPAAVPGPTATAPAAARPAAAPVTVAPAPAVVAPAPPVAAAPVSNPAQSQFGLEERRSATVQEVSSSIAGLFEGWGPATKFKLDNGQVWQITDGSSASYYLRSPKVKVARAALGSFRLEIEGANQAPRVRRVE